MEKDPNAMLAVLWAGFACGVLDITAALVVYGYLGAKPIPLLQGIASGLLGPKAFQGGLATALLGLFVTLSSRLVRLRSILWRAAQFLFWFSTQSFLVLCMAWPFISS